MIRKCYGLLISIIFSVAVEPEHDRVISKKPNKSELTESSKVQIRKKVEANIVPRELPVEKTTATSLLKKPLLKDNKVRELFNFQLFLA